MQPLEQEVGDLSALSVRELAQVVDLWKRTSRELVTRFTGTSMHPTIASSSEVILRCGSSVNAGDIIAYCRGEQLIVHRVVAMSHRREWLIARGDASVVPDPLLIPSRAVVGTIVAVEQNGSLVHPGPAPRRAFRAAFVDAMCRALLILRFPAGMIQRFLLGVRFLRLRLNGRHP